MSCNKKKVSVILIKNSKEFTKYFTLFAFVIIQIKKGNQEARFQARLDFKFLHWTVCIPKSTPTTSTTRKGLKIMQCNKSDKEIEL